MTMTGIYAVGFCAHYSPQGDWAFDFALSVARTRSLQLNVFHFLTDPYNRDDPGVTGLSEMEVRRVSIERERELRLYYDGQLGDYLQAGFRVCEDREWTELHRCLTKREFQILVLAYPSYNVEFGGKWLEDFAHCFICPVVLVGPTSPAEFHLNQPAMLIADRLGLKSPECKVVTTSAHV